MLPTVKRITKSVKVLGQKQATWIVLLAILGAGSARAGTNVWTSLGSDGGIVAMAVDPQNAGTLYAATAAGLFKSADEGASWSAVKPGPPCCISTLLINPQDPSILYALTRVAGLSLDPRVLKSTDGGTNWSPVNSGLPVDADGHYGVASLAIDPQNTNTLYAGNALLGGGVFKTSDGGQSWTAVSAGLPDEGIMALAIDPQNPVTIYASARKSGVFHSTDGGAGWGGLSAGLGIEITRGYDYISILAVNPQNPSTIYAAGHNLRDFEDSGVGLFKTRDAGASWTGVNFFSDRTVTALAIDAQNPGTVYAGTYAGVFKSTDGGTSWSAVRSRLTADTYGSLAISTLAIDPQNPDTVYAAGTYAGLLKTTDAGASWTAVNSELRATTPTGILALRIDPQNPGTIYAGTDAGVFKTTDAGANWTGVNAGLTSGFFGHVPVSILEIDPQNPSTVYAIGPCGQDLCKSTDGGANWIGALAREADGLVVRGTRLNASALAVDPRDPGTLYVAGNFNQCCPTNGASGVLKSTNGGASWSGVSSGLPVPARDYSVFVTNLAIDQKNPNTIYAGVGQFGVGARGSAAFKTTNGGDDWRMAGMAGFTRVDLLAIDPQNPSTVYARAVDRTGCPPQRVPGGWDGCGWLVKTTNGGASWSVANTGLPNYVTALAIDPQNPSTLYAGSGSGVFRSTDGAANWDAVNSGLTILSVSTLAVDPQNPNTVYAGTADGGVFAITFVP